LQVRDGWPVLHHRPYVGGFGQSMIETTDAGLRPRTIPEESVTESFAASQCARCGALAEGFDATAGCATCAECARRGPA